jgi:cytochrome P450
MSSLATLRGAGRDPSQGYADLHEDGSVHTNSMMWLVVGYDAGSVVLKDTTHFSSEITMGFTGRLGRTMLFTDPPDHTRLRGVVADPFKPRALAKLEPRIREIARSLLDKMKPGEPFEIMSGLARPLPVIVISEMLGLDQSALDLDRWSDASIGMAQMMAMSAGEGRESLFASAIEARRGEPRDDLISLLVQALDDGLIDQGELLGACALLFIAGNVTTTSLLGNAVNLLARHPDQCKMMSDDPSRTPNALEEVFRYDPPVPAVPPRRCIAETELDGHKVPVDTNVVVYAAAANRDPAKFNDPDQFDISRPEAGSHLTLGAGIHYCLGAYLSRLESKVAMEELLDRSPVLELADPSQQVSYNGSSFLRAPNQVTIRA